MWSQKRLTLDAKAFQALAIESRIRILKELDVRQKTASELAAALKLSVSTVAEHLEKLEAVGLVHRLKKENYKWVYWRLAEKGYNLLHPSESLSITLLLSVALFAFVYASNSLLNFFTPVPLKTLGAVQGTLVQTETVPIGSPVGVPWLSLSALFVAGATLGAALIIFKRAYYK